MLGSSVSLWGHKTLVPAQNLLFNRLWQASSHFPNFNVSIWKKSPKKIYIFDPRAMISLKETGECSRISKLAVMVFHLADSVSLAQPQSCKENLFFVRDFNAKHLFNFYLKQKRDSCCSKLQIQSKMNLHHSIQSIQSWWALAHKAGGMSRFH